MNNKLIIVSIPFSDWEESLTNQEHLLIRKNQIHGKNILPISTSDYFLSHSIFKNTKETISILSNKSMFGKFMLTYFPTFIPRIYYYNFLDETFLSPESPDTKLIQKPNLGSGGNGITIVDKIDMPLKGYIISEYIEHTKYYAGHFLVQNGKIYDKTFFCSSYSYPNGIKKGRIIEYTSSDSLPVDDSIFSNIFEKLSYSGFADSDFTIVEDRIVIFEINPRPGGSLIHNKVYLSRFIDTAYRLYFTYKVNEL